MKCGHAGQNVRVASDVSLAGGGGEHKSSLSHREGERENMAGVSQLLAENKSEKVLKVYNRETDKQGSV